MTSEWAHKEPEIHIQSGLPLTGYDGLLVNRLHRYPHFRGIELRRHCDGCNGVSALVAYNREMATINGPLAEVLAVATMLVGGWDA